MYGLQRKATGSVIEQMNHDDDLAAAVIGGEWRCIHGDTRIEPTEHPTPIKVGLPVGRDNSQQLVDVQVWHYLRYRACGGGDGNLLAARRDEIDGQIRPECPMRERSTVRTGFESDEVYAGLSGLLLRTSVLALLFTQVRSFLWMLLTGGSQRNYR